MGLWINLLGIAIFANWLTWWFTPLEFIREYFVNKMVKWIVKYNMLYVQPLLTVFTCPKCIAFWGTLLWSMNLSYALITSFLAAVIQYILKYVESKSY